MYGSGRQLLWSGLAVCTVRLVAEYGCPGASFLPLGYGVLSMRPFEPALEGLAVRVMTHLPNWRLLVAGSGSDEARLRRLARRWGVDGQIVFLGHLPRGDLLTLMREETDVFLFPSLREEAGWVVAEAQISGLVVVCLGLGGPALLGARQVSATAAGRQVLRSLAAQVADSGKTPGGSDFGLEARARRLEMLVAESGLLPNTARSPGRRR